MALGGPMWSSAPTNRDDRGRGKAAGGKIYDMGAKEDGGVLGKVGRFGGRFAG